VKAALTALNALSAAFTASARRHTDSLALICTSAALALAVLIPLLGRGFVLNYDMVFAPTQSILPDSLGLGSTLPRSVPADAVVAPLTQVLPGDIVQKMLLFLALFAGALGAGRLVPADRLATRVIAAVAYGWTAYVAERLLIGHWPYLLAYASLPWIALAALALRRRAPGSLPRLVLAAALACITPTGGLLATGTAVALAGWRRAALTVPAMIVLNAPWWVPALLHPGGTASSAAGVGAFAARTESWGTPVLSLLGLGGIWNADTTPASRANPVLPVLTLAMVAVALLGLRRLAARWDPATTRALVLLGAVGVLLAALGSLPVGAEVLRWVGEYVPGGGLLRDGQKWVAWWALPLAIGFALGVERACEYLRSQRARRALLAAAALGPIVILPDLALAGWGRLGAVGYPADWHDVRTILAGDERPGDVLALPLSALRRYGWNDERTQLDPAPRFFTRTVILDDTVYVGRQPVAGEDQRLPAIRATLRDRGDLGRLGVGWILVEHGTPGRLDPAVLDGLRVEYSGPWLSLYRVPGEVDPGAYPGAPRLPVLLAGWVALAVVVLSAFWLLWSALPVGRVGSLARPVRVPEE
jgi:hypothetical protein